MLRYLRGTANYKLCYQEGDLQLVGYSDADGREELDEEKSISRYVFLVNNGII